ncbi:MAG: helix-turn-helix domain-containing protein [Clostridia bacterium]|nr:helix-turn-helix domain-containing protein [Clostridia bacterium]
MTIKELRMGKALTRGAFAKSLGISLSALDGFESGRRRIDDKVLAKIREVYGVDLAGPITDAAAEPVAEQSAGNPEVIPEVVTAEEAVVVPADEVIGETEDVLVEEAAEEAEVIPEEKAAEEATVVPEVAAAEEAAVVPDEAASEEAEVVPEVAAAEKAEVIPEEAPAENTDVIPVEGTSEEAAVVPDEAAPEEGAVVPDEAASEEAEVIPEEKAAEEAEVVPDEVATEETEIIPEEEVIEETIEDAEAVPDAITAEEEAARIAAEEKAARKAAKKAARKQKADEEAARWVAEAINALSSLTDAFDEDVVAAARSAYDSLTDDQEDLVPGDLVSLLIKAERQIEEASKTFPIADCWITVKDVPYTGKKIKRPSVKVELGETKLEEDVDYTFKYDKKAQDIGLYALTVKGKGRFTGSVDVPFYVVPKAKTLYKLLKGGKQAELEWKCLNNIKGYQIEYSLKEDLSDSRKVKIKKAKDLAKAIEKLKPGKKYYARIRVYAKVDGKKYHSDWSKVKAFKT